MLKAARLKDLKLKRKVDRIKREHRREPVEKISLTVEKDKWNEIGDEKVEGWENEEYPYDFV